MNDHACVLGLVNRLYKLQRCDRLDQQHLIAPGDLIEYIRGPFSHWAVYLGDHRIAHLPGPSNLLANFQVRVTPHGALRPASEEHLQIFQTLWRWISGHSIEPMDIEIRDFDGLLSTSIAYINNSKDRVLRPSADEDILRRAYNAVGFTGYDLILNNCEHFAHWCRFVLSGVRVLPHPHPSVQIRNCRQRSSVQFSIPHVQPWLSPVLHGMDEASLQNACLHCQRHPPRKCSVRSNHVPALRVA